MKQRPRIYYSATQGAIIWDRWRKGETIHHIAGLFDRFHSSIQRILAESGGIRRGGRDRFESGLWAAVPCRRVARRAREIGRNGGLEGYGASAADQAAWDRACRAKVCKLVQNRA